MRYAHNVARGYDDRAATTRALMCLPAGMMELVPPKIEGAASVPEQRGGRRHVGRDAWRALLEAGWGETTSKTPQLPRVASVAFGAEGVLLERSCWPLAIARASQEAGASTILPKRRCSFRSSVLSPSVRVFEPFFCGSCSAAEYKASQGVQSTHTSKHSVASKDCCAQNKSGYLRIRATDRKKRRDAVTNGQGRQGREDLQDQARPRRRNRIDGRRSAGC